MTPDGATERDGVAHRPSRPSRLRKVVDKGPADEAQLARMVRELHELEDEITAKLTAADRVLAQLASRRTHEDGGYKSWAEFEERMLAASPVLRAMREAPTAGPPAAEATSAAGKRDALDARTRQTKALTSMARALERLRGLEAELHECASSAANKLSTIEGMRVYEECGYVSFEEFLERALGPSPVLASAVALVANEPPSQNALPPVPPVEPVAAAVADGPAFPPALFPDDSALSGAAFMASEPEETPSAKEDVSEATEASSSQQTDGVAAARRTRASLVVSILLCAAAIIVGAAAGVGSGILSRAHQTSEASSESAATTSSTSAMASNPPGKVASDVKPAGHVVKGTPPAGSPVTH